MTHTPRHGIDPAAATTPMPRVDVTPHLTPRTLDWLAKDPRARRLVRSVWDKLNELERSGQHSGTIEALRWFLAQHQPTPAGRCRTCRRVTWRRRPFPCVVWHRIRFDLLGLVAGGGRHRPAVGPHTGPWTQ